jgi:hypothetical protein
MNKGRSSKISLLSAVTSQSSGSNGSNSTVTQESYNKSKSDSGRKKKSKRKKEVVKVKIPAMEAVEEAISEDEDQDQDQQEEVDVFAFLVDDENADPDAQDEDIERSTDKDLISQSQHSDSGISMDDGSIILGETVMKPLLPTASERRQTEADDRSRIRFNFSWPEVPKASQPIFLPANLDGCDQVDHNPVHFKTDSPISFPATPDRSVFRCPPTVAYEKILSKLEEGHVPFRTFTVTSQRLLMEQQQEISGLEDEIKRIEESIRQLQHPDSSSTAGRRGSWDWYHHPQELHAMRADVVGRLSSKLEQYCEFTSLECHGY